MRGHIFEIFLSNHTKNFLQQKIKTNLRHSVVWKKKYHKLFLEQQQKRSWKSHYNHRGWLHWFSWVGSLTAGLQITSIYQLKCYWYGETLSITSSPWQQLTMPLKLFFVNELGTMTLVWRPARTAEVLRVNSLLRQDCKLGECKLCEFFLFYVFRLHCTWYWLLAAKSVPTFIFISNNASCS